MNLRSMLVVLLTVSARVTEDKAEQALVQRYLRELNPSFDSQAPSWGPIREAHYGLVQAGEAAVPYLVKRLRVDGFWDSFHGNHSETMKILEKIGAPAVEPLLNALRKELEDLAARNELPRPEAEVDPDDFVRSGLSVLGVIRDERAIPFLLELLEMPVSRDWKETVLWELERFTTEAERDLAPPGGRRGQHCFPDEHFARLRRVLRRHLTRENEVLAGSIARLFERVGEAEDAVILRGALAWVSEYDRSDVARAFHHLGRSEWPPLVEEFLEKDDSDAAVEFLDAITDAELDRPPVPKLLEWLEQSEDTAKGPDRKFAASVSSLLERATFQDFGRNLADWKAWWERHEGLPREKWAEAALRELEAKIDRTRWLEDKPETFERLIRLAPLAPGEVERLARKSLAKGIAAALEQRKSGFESPRCFYLDTGAVEALLATKSASAFRFLDPFLGSGNREERLFAVRALEAVGAPAARERLQRALQDPDPEVALEAAEIELERGNRQALDVIVRHLDANLEPERSVRLLRDCTQVYMGYEEGASEDEVRRVIARWRAWWDKNCEHFDMQEALRRKAIDDDWSI